jgi:hypothetical protein
MSKSTSIGEDFVVTSKYDKAAERAAYRVGWGTIFGTVAAAFGRAWAV